MPAWLWPLLMTLLRTSGSIAGGMATQKVGSSLLGKLTAGTAMEGLAGRVGTKVTGSVGEGMLGKLLGKGASAAVGFPGHLASFASFVPGMMGADWLLSGDEGEDEHTRLAQALQAQGGEPPDHAAQRQVVDQLTKDDLLRQAIEQIMEEQAIL